MAGCLVYVLTITTVLPHSKATGEHGENSTLFIQYRCEQSHKVSNSTLYWLCDECESISHSFLALILVSRPSLLHVSLGSTASRCRAGGVSAALLELFLDWKQLPAAAQGELTKSVKLQATQHTLQIMLCRFITLSHCFHIVIWENVMKQWLQLL